MKNNISMINKNEYNQMKNYYIKSNLSKIIQNKKSIINKKSNVLPELTPNFNKSNLNSQ